MITRPRRFQRVQGGKMPAGAVYVGQGTKWGHHTHREASSEYRAWLGHQVMLQRLELQELRGKDLVCWCRLSASCHGDVLLDLANADGAAPIQRGVTLLVHAHRPYLVVLGEPPPQQYADYDEFELDEVTEPIGRWEDR